MCVCVCVCVCVCSTLMTKLSPRKKKLDVHKKVYFVVVFLPVSLYLTSNIIVSVESIQEDQTESRSLNWGRIARDQKTVTSFSYLST